MNQVLKVSNYLFTITILVSLLLFSNCSEDDEGGDTNTSDLIGTWTVSSVNTDLAVGGKSLTQYLVDQGYESNEAVLIETFFKAFLEADFVGSTIELKSDNTYLADFEDDPDTGTWSYDASSKILTIDSDDLDEDDIEIKIKSLTSDTLVIEQSDTYQEDVDDDGDDDDIEASIEMTLTKS